MHQAGTSEAGFIKVERSDFFELCRGGVLTAAQEVCLERAARRLVADGKRLTPLVDGLISINDEELEPKKRRDNLCLKRSTVLEVIASALRSPSSLQDLTLDIQPIRALFDKRGSDHLSLSEITQRISVIRVLGIVGTNASNVAEDILEVVRTERGQLQGVPTFEAGLLALAQIYKREPKSSVHSATVEILLDLLSEREQLFLAVRVAGEIKLDAAKDLVTGILTTATDPVTCFECLTALTAIGELPRRAINWVVGQIDERYPGVLITTTMEQTLLMFLAECSESVLLGTSEKVRKLAARART